MIPDMTYDGQVLTWGGHGKFRATSGMPGHQTPDESCTPDAGPVPPGLYKVFLANQGTAKDDGRNMCNLAPSWGIQQIPRGEAAGSCEEYWANWGTYRARMEAADTATRNRCSVVRGGFYLHDSIKGFSHGCIEVEQRIFPLLLGFARSSGRSTVLLRVEYVGNRATNGGTKVGG